MALGSASATAGLQKGNDRGFSVARIRMWRKASSWGSRVRGGVVNDLLSIAPGQVFLSGMPIDELQ